ncbi:hypothetical protein D7V92_04510 [Parabacteroides sp. CH2-D42-20]|uniref:response regulator receiver domain n=1 Tax=Parabacteroides sp. CH2-D42-20 TaxID=2320086 RepID=UPI000EF69BEA|nr:response regulator receiver domain [Parabacteroides sp. CH2-D42-20]RLT70624.1 hypothetical protein D7V92_04510 [Parabacteroides sp. CH2-D42-20]
MDNTFKSVAQNIINESIKSAVFIDDEIPMLFSGEDDKTGICKPLYESFQMKDCSVDFSKFSNLESIRDKLLFDRKDLLILDWELDLVEPKYKSTLEIIDKAVKTDNLHFVCIYSHKGDNREDIFYKILAYYSGNSLELLEKNNQDIIDFIEEDGWGDSIDIINKIISKTKEFTLNVISRKDYKTFLRNEFKERYDEFEALVKSKYSSEKQSNYFIKLAFDLAKTEIYRCEPKKVYVNCKGNYLQINNTFFAVFKKGTTNPDDLYNDFSEAISSANEAFLTFLSMEMRNKLMSKSSLIGKGLSRINESAFFHHKQTIVPNEAFDEFLIELWENYNTAWLYKEKSSLLAAIDDYQKDKAEAKPSDEDLARLNYYYNIDHTILMSQRNIGFGDIFIIDQGDDSKEQYILCITPHCDCLRPNKIKGFYYFVCGQTTKINRGLELADSGFISFIQNRQEEIICIEWDLKPFTLHVCEKQRNISTSTAIVFGDKVVDFRYCCTLKENYCQRITNKSFSNPIRVGISFVKKEASESCKKFQNNTCRHIKNE